MMVYKIARIADPQMDRQIDEICRAINLHLGETNSNPHGTDHDMLEGLADDDHAQYLLLAGRAGQRVVSPLVIGTATDNTTVEADGTILLNGNAAGYVDIFFPHGLPKTTGVGNPSLVTYLGSLRGYEYAVNDAHDLDPQEYYHQCVVGGAAIWHLHWISRTNVAAARTVKWELERSFVSPTGVETLISPNATVEITVPANTPALTHFVTDITIDTIANIGPAWMISARIKRIASSGTEPATAPMVKALHCHVKIDTPAGSRLVSSK